MAKILVGSTALMGHVVPLAPIVAELVARGHEVRWYTGSQFRERVEATGASYAPMRFAPDPGVHGINDLFPGRSKLTGISSLLFDVEHLFTAPVVGQVLDMQEMLKEFPADVIFADAAFLAAGWVHELGGPPWAVLNPFAITLSGRGTAPFGLGYPPATSRIGRLRARGLQEYGKRVLYRGSTRLADRLRQRVGLPPTGELFWDRTVSPFLYMQGSIRGLEYPRDDLPAQFHFIGPTTTRPASSPFSPPEWWDELRSGRPVVHVTQGTLSNSPDQLLVPALRGLASENVLTVATTGGGATSAISAGDIPENARIETFIPYDHLLPYVDVMVTNGGYNGVQMALGRGVPLVVAGATEDKLETNARVVWAGAGIDLNSATPSEKQIRTAVRRILDDKRYRDRAQSLAVEFSTQDGPSTGADLLEQLGHTGKPVIDSTRPRHAGESSPQLSFRPEGDA